MTDSDPRSVEPNSSINSPEPNSFSDGQEKLNSIRRLSGILLEWVALDSDHNEKNPILVFHSGFVLQLLAEANLQQPGLIDLTLTPDDMFLLSQQVTDLDLFVKKDKLDSLEAWAEEKGWDVKKQEDTEPYVPGSAQVPHGLVITTTEGDQIDVWTLDDKLNPDQEVFSETLINHNDITWVSINLDDDRKVPVLDLEGMKKHMKWVMAFDQKHKDSNPDRLAKHQAKYDAINKILDRMNPPRKGRDSHED